MSGASPGGASLAMLVQQREQQNSKKLESLVAKNEELCEANLHAEREREALLARLGDLDARLSATDAVCQHLQGTTQETTQAHNGRMTYLEQGIEERFGLLENDMRGVQQSASAANAVREERELDMEMVEKLIVEAMAHAAQTSNDRIASLQAELQAKDTAITSLHLQLASVAKWVGGVALQEELQRVSEEHTKSLEAAELKVEGDKRSVAKQLASLTERIIHSDAQHKSIEENHRTNQDTVSDRLAFLEASLDTQNASIETYKTQLSGMSESVSRIAQRDTSANESAARAEGAVQAVDGRLNTVEGTLYQLQTKLIESVEGSVETRLRTEKLEANLGENAGNVIALSTEVKEMHPVLRSLKEEVESSEAENQARHTRLEEMLSTVITDLSVIDEKRRQGAKEESAADRRMSEINRTDLQDLRKEIELLKDASPVVDEGRLQTLVSEVERNKQSIELLRDPRTSLRQSYNTESVILPRSPRGRETLHEKSGSLERRLETLESALEQDERQSAAVSPMRSGRRLADPIPQTHSHTVSYGAETLDMRGLGVTGSRGATPPPALQNVNVSHAHRRSSGTPPPGRPPQHLSPQQSSSTSSGDSLSPQEGRGRVGDGYDPVADAKSAFERDFDAAFSTALEGAQLPVSGGGGVVPVVPLLTPLVMPQSSAAVAEVKQAMEERLVRSRDITQERRRLEADLEKVNQHLAFNQMAFQTVADKEGALGMRSPFFASVCHFFFDL